LILLGEVFGNGRLKGVLKMPTRYASIKRNSIQTLSSCIPGCFRLAQKYFIRIEDVESKRRGEITPITLNKPGAMKSFNINRVSWTYIWNEIYPIGTDRHKRLLPIISDNRFIGGGLIVYRLLISVQTVSKVLCSSFPLGGVINSNLD